MSLFNTLLPGSGQANVKKLKVKEFLSSGNWVRHAGVDTVEVFLVGAGGGGGGKDGSPTGATGSGGGGEVTRKIVDVTSISVGSTIAVTIGAGGAGGTTSGTAGGAGGSTSFGALLVALGGGGGSGLAASAGVASGVTSGIASQGGGAALVGSSGGICGLGGGAGGTAIGSYSTTYTTGQPQAPRSNSVQGVVVGLEMFSLQVNHMHTPAYAAKGVGDYGAGGGSGDAYTGVVIAEKNAGQQNMLNAVANSGCGGAGRIVPSVTALAGGNGGSGYALISWWE